MNDPVEAWKVAYDLGDEVRVVGDLWSTRRGAEDEQWRLNASRSWVVKVAFVTPYPNEYRRP